MATLPRFQFTNQEDWRWSIPFFDTEGAALPLVDKAGNRRNFMVEIAKSGAGKAAIKTLKVLSGIEFEDAGTALAFRLDRSETLDFVAGEYTADVLEILEDGSRQLFIPVRISFGEPIAVTEYLRRGIGVSYSPNRIPVTTNVALPGLQGERGPGFIPGSGPPTPGDGRINDYWIDNAADPPVLYGPKTAVGWPAEGDAITSKLTPELQAARDAAVAAAAGSRADASAVAVDRQAVGASVVQVEASHRAVIAARTQTTQDAASSIAARDAASLAEQGAAAARDAAQIQATAATQQAATASASVAEIAYLASLISASAYDMGYLNEPIEASDDFDFGDLV